MEQKKIPIGYEDFKKFKEENLYLVDKTLMIQELLDTGAQTTLLTRPRRFGKTLNLSMLRRFFEDERTPAGEKIDNQYLFDGLAIMEAGEKYLAHMGQYPVINLSLKSAKQVSFAMAYDSIVDDIIKEFERHAYVLSGEMTQKDRAQFTAIREGNAEDIAYASALEFLSACLYDYHEKEVVILIDSYDELLQNACFKGFYNKISCFLRPLLESALKGNPYMKLGVVAGCMGISTDSSYSEFINFDIQSVINQQFSSYFGFTNKEVQAILEYFDMINRFEEVQDRYGSYMFGNTEIYNPVSILCYMKKEKDDTKNAEKAYETNDINFRVLKFFIENADEKTREELEILMDGGTIEKPVHEKITYGDIHASRDNLWNFLFFTGYLKMKSQRIEGETIYLQMTIPNKEIKSIYRQTITGWFDRKMEDLDKIPLIKALEEGDCEAAENFISEQLMDTISYFDYAESYYHGFLSGLLTNNGRYSVISNRESGNGRPDLVLKTKAIRKGNVIILELKAAGSIAEMELKCEEALQQIEEQKYAQGFLSEGYPQVNKYAIVFYRKECMVQRER